MNNPVVRVIRKTGRTRYRQSLFGKVILQVEDEYFTRELTHPAHMPPAISTGRKLWRDASWKDIA